MPCASLDDSTVRVPRPDTAMPEEERRQLHPLEEAALSWSVSSPAELAAVRADWCSMQDASRLELLDPRQPPLLPEQLKEIAGKSSCSSLLSCTLKLRHVLSGAKLTAIHVIHEMI